MADRGQTQISVRRGVIALGSNLPSWAGEPSATLKAAIEVIGALEGVHTLAVSPVLRSKPAYRGDQPDFANAVMIVEYVPGDPFVLLDTLQAIEQRFGREHKTVNGPRTLDIDIIDIEGVVSDDPDLLLPHPCALERDFVLEPLRMIAPDYVFADGSEVAACAPCDAPRASAGGVLLVCATPIGNLGDLTPRVAEALAGVDVICAEDTRITRRLLTHLNLRVPMERCDEQVIRARTPELIDRLKAGERIAYVSDAGTPGISDPGMYLVAAAHAAGVRVEALPGASALTAAVAVAGFEASALYFGGFLPRKDGQRRELLARLAELQAVLVFYESPHRLVASLAVIAEVYGEREMVMARELTKLHEEVLRASAINLHQIITERASERASDRPLRGEIVLVIAAPNPPKARRAHRDKYAR
ncbi:MAG: 16S rRNA (cytidine(1402)-2'-O)-methyltransferase [Coriobacteriales bacterium]|jgi:16S rRNA (cytidine1402-2'-O)-methyltransferase|nr:16S rRNA (cytidine(1402)-2'-O)-methyltransferase [Coriobacteriales bacterium]